MKVKRYGIHFNYGDPVMVERPDGEFYSRADLIAAGCLVPVPDGEVCKFNEVDTPHVMFLGQVYDWFSLRKDGAGAKPISGGEPVGVVVAVSTIVQPVRLVRLEDVG